MHGNVRNMLITAFHNFIAHFTIEGAAQVAKVLAWFFLIPFPIVYLIRIRRFRVEIRSRKWRSLLLAVAYIFMLIFGDGRLRFNYPVSHEVALIQQGIFKYIYGGVVELAMSARAFKTLHQRLDLFEKAGLDDVKNHVNIQRLSRRVMSFERKLYPWVNGRFNSLQALKKTYYGRGIVLPLGKGHVPFALTMLESLRLVNCSLPVIAYYHNEADLRPWERDILHKFGVETIDLSKIFNDAILALESSAGKPFALLAAPFRESILIEADVVLLQTPEILFEDPDYRQKRILYFRDRSWQINDKRFYFPKTLPRPLSDQVLKSRYYGQTSHRMEAGLIVIDKTDRFYSLLATCLLNNPLPRKIIWQNLSWGEKETFWLGSEIAEEPYAFDRSVPGMIGQLEENPPTNGRRWLCGRMVHVHSNGNGQPMWINGALVYKSGNWSETLDFQYWAEEGIWRKMADCVEPDDGRLLPIPMQTKENLRHLNRYWLSVIKYRNEP